MQTIELADVIYKVSTEDFEQGFTEITDVSSSINYKKKEDEETNVMLGVIEEDDFFSNIHANSSEMFMTINEMKAISGSVTEIYPTKLKIPKYFYEDRGIIGGRLSVGCQVNNINIDGKLYTGTLKKRYCPHCKKRLLKEAGQVPILNIGMLGHSSAGKTVFLVMQYYSAIKQKFNRKIHKGELFIEHVDSHLDIVSNDVIFAKVNSFKTSGEIPGTTQKNPDPHCLRISYRLKKENGEFSNEDVTTCILCFHDIIGELLTNDNPNAEEYMKVANICKKADAFIIVNDPYALEFSRQNLPEHVLKAFGVNDGTIDEMIKKLTNLFDIIGGAVSQPTICLLAKIDDILFNNNNLMIDTAEPALAEDMKSEYFADKDKNWAVNVYESLSRSSKKILTHLDKGGNWMNTVNQYFTDAIHIPVSSIGSEVKILELPKKTEKETDTTKKEEIDTIKRLVTVNQWKEYIKYDDDKNRKEMIENIMNTKISPDSIKPRFIELPMLTFLMQFGFIPPMYLNEYNNNLDANFDIWYQKCAMTNDAVSEKSFANELPPQYNFGKKSSVPTLEKVVGLLFRKHK